MMEKTISEKERKFLLELARKAIESHPREVDVRKDALTKVMEEPRGIFVTLKMEGKLRGCIGYIEPIKPLYEAVRDCAVNAAYSDPRFSPLSKDEFKKVKIEISVLTLPQPLEYENPDELLDKLTGDDGVVLKNGTRQATFLPQVWHKIPLTDLFLEQLSMKAGLSKDAWKDSETEIETYRVEKFSEE